MPDRVDADGMPASEVGIWTLEKHQRLEKYIVASHGARRRFKDRTSYIDLYCGSGRSWIRDTSEFIDGSPLIALKASLRSGDKFGKFHLADINPAYIDAVSKRMEAAGGSVTTYVGPALETVRKVVKRLDPYGLHFAFLDPYNLGLPFAVIQELAKFQRMDLLIHISVMHLKRELPKWLASDAVPCELDDFAPGWRAHIDARRPQEAVRAQIFEYWKGEIHKLRMSASDDVRAVENEKSSDLYWLALISRHELADKLWRAIANISDQREMF